MRVWEVAKLDLGFEDFVGLLETFGGVKNSGIPLSPLKKFDLEESNVAIKAWSLQERQCFFGGNI